MVLTLNIYCEVEGTNLNSAIIREVIERWLEEKVEGEYSFNGFLDNLEFPEESGDIKSVTLLLKRDAFERLQQRSKKK